MPRLFASTLLATLLVGAVASADDEQPTDTAPADEGSSGHARPVESTDTGTTDSASPDSGASGGTDEATPQRIVIPQVKKAPAPEAPARAPAPAPEPAPTPVPTTEVKPETTSTLHTLLSKWSVELYGFAELDTIQDSTQGLLEVPGGTLIAKPGTFAGDHQQLQMSIRNSRIGFKFASPETHGVKASGIFEADFMGNEQSISQVGGSGGNSEAAFFNNPSFRVRNAALKLETPIVDILAGQYWELFGWQSTFQPASVEVQGLPGEVYSRTAQIRLSHAFKGEWVTFEVAAALLRPPERDADVPDLQGGLKLTLNKWQGVHTNGSAATGTDGLTLGVSGVMRKFSIPSAVSSSDPEVGATGSGVSFDALIPIIPASADNRSNGLTVSGSFVSGTGIADLYSSLNGGYGFPSCMAGTEGTSCKTYTAPIDSGLVAFDSSNNLQTINWQSFIFGAQYYLPPSGNVWIAANYSHMSTSNGTALAGSSAASKTLYALEWFDANLFWDITPAARLGLEYARTTDTYNDSSTGTNNRYQLSFFYLF